MTLIQELSSIQLAGADLKLAAALVRRSKVRFVVSHEVQHSTEARLHQPQRNQTAVSNCNIARSSAKISRAPQM
jgi:hypothetical protein